MDYELFLGDCLPIMKTMPDKSVDAVIVDLPYYNVVKSDWDRQWESRKEYVGWVVSLAVEWKRLTKDNSSLFIFCDEKMEAYLQVALDEMFLLLNKIVWYKTNNLPQKNAHLLRTFAPMTERALFYTTQYDSTGWESVKLDVNNFESLRKYFYDLLVFMGETNNGISKKLGHRKAEHSFYVMPRKEIIDTLGGQADHCFKYGSTQWDLPTEETYNELIKFYGIDKFTGFKEYEVLCQEYKVLCRPFNADAKTFDVLQYPIVSQSENSDHPTTKPLQLMKRIVSIITKPDQVVLDCCMGSGSTLVACGELGRKSIGIEQNADYFQIAKPRIERAYAQKLLFKD